MTPEQRYTKAIDIPPSEWAKILEGTPFKRVDVNFDKGHLYLKAPGGYMVVDKDGWFNSMHREVDGRKIIGAIDSYAPEVELAWEDKITANGEPFGDCGPMTYYVEVLNGRDYVIWQFTMSGGLVTKGLAYPDGEITAIERGISAAKAAAGELIKSVLKPG